MNSIFDDVIPLDATRMVFASTALRELLIPSGQSTQPSLLPCPTAEAEMAELLEARVREELKKCQPQHRLEGWLCEKTSKWRCMSGMQKAVRRGNTLLAYKSARALLVGGCGHDLWRRLGVIATEDVGLTTTTRSANIRPCRRHKKSTARGKARLGIEPDYPLPSRQQMRLFLTDE